MLSEAVTSANMDVFKANVEMLRAYERRIMRVNLGSRDTLSTFDMSYSQTEVT